MKPADAAKSALKEKFIAERGYWNGVWDQILDHDPDFFEAYLDLSSYPWRHGVLAPKVKEFIYIAIDASTTHMYRPGLKVHLQNALRHGATKDEIMEVLQLTAVIGLQTCTVGAPLLMNEISACGLSVDTAGFFDVCQQFAAAATGRGNLDKKTGELIQLAVNAAVTHLQEQAMAVHMRNALAAGATAQEVFEVLQLVSVLGIHACTLGVQMLADELKALEEAR